MGKFASSCARVPCGVCSAVPLLIPCVGTGLEKQCHMVPVLPLLLRTPTFGHPDEAAGFGVVCLGCCGLLGSWSVDGRYVCPDSLSVYNSFKRIH